MGRHFSLTAADKHQLGAYRADPKDRANGAIVVIQEIFGVNSHVRAVCDRFAESGYVAVAPALFDRTQRNFECGYSPDEIANARKFIANPDWDAMLRDSQAAIDVAASSGPVAIVGFCMGGTVALVVDTERDLGAAVTFYGGGLKEGRFGFPPLVDAAPHLRAVHVHPGIHAFGSDRLRRPDGGYLEPWIRESLG